MSGHDWAPHPNEPAWPRYSGCPFPAYRFVPGKTPHPRRDPRGHSYGLADLKLDGLRPDAWSESDAYRHGIDLYNFAYWWESHEVFEAFWHAVGRQTEQGQFFQALIQLAAANLKHFTNYDAAAHNLLTKSLRLLTGLPHHYMGIDIANLRDRMGEAPASSFSQLLITLEFRDRPSQK